VLRIKRIIPYLNGKYKNFGPKRMQDTRYLVLLYGATMIDEFNRKGTPHRRLRYFSYNQLYFISRSPMLGDPLQFERTRTARKVYSSLKKKGWVRIENRIDFESGGHGQGVAITAKGIAKAKNMLKEIENGLLKEIPEQQQLTQEDKGHDEKYHEDHQNQVADHQPPLTKNEVRQFVKKHSAITDEELFDKTTDEIYDESRGDPVMVKFYTMEKRLEHDVKEMSDCYLGSQLRMKTTLICSILDISNTEITDNLLEKCGVLETAHKLNSLILYRNSDGLWKTKSRRWALKLFSFFFNNKIETELEVRKQDLKDSLIALYQMREAKMTYSAIKTLYHIVDKNFAPKAVVESVFQQSKCQIPKEPFFVYLYVSDARSITDAYYPLKKDIEGNDRLDKEASHSELEEAKRCYSLGDYEETMKYCDEALEIDPSSAAASDLKREAMARIYDSNDNSIAK
jgi:hypothetical protein